MKRNTFKYALGAALLAVGAASNAQAAEVRYGYTSLPRATAARVATQGNFSDNHPVQIYPGYWSAAQTNAAKAAVQTRHDKEGIQLVQFYPGFYSLPSSRGTRNEFEGLLVAQSDERGDS